MIAEKEAPAIEKAASEAIAGDGPAISGWLSRIVRSEAPIVRPALPATDVALREIGERVVSTLGSANAVYDHLLGLPGFTPAYAREVADSFGPGAVELVESGSLPFQRIHGGGAGPIGRWLFRDGLVGARESLALPNSNTAEALSIIDVPAGTRMLRGRVGAQAQWARGGGGTQYYALSTEGFTIREEWVRTLPAEVAARVRAAKQPVFIYVTGAAALGIAGGAGGYYLLAARPNQ